jgi:hypothetical protein
VASFYVTIYNYLKLLFVHAGCFLDKCMYKNDLGVTVTHNYWATSHGKGEHDGAAAHVKQSIRKQNIKMDERLLIRYVYIIDTHVVYYVFYCICVCTCLNASHATWFICV